MLDCPHPQAGPVEPARAAGCWSVSLDRDLDADGLARAGCRASRWAGTDVRATRVNLHRDRQPRSVPIAGPRISSPSRPR
jgi:hypothetical protein